MRENEEDADGRKHFLKTFFPTEKLMAKCGNKTTFWILLLTEHIFIPSVQQNVYRRKGTRETFNGSKSK